MQTGERSYRVTVRGFDPSFVRAAGPGGAKYRVWIRSACEAGYWASFSSFVHDIESVRLRAGER